MGTVTINSVVYIVYGDIPGATSYLNARLHAFQAWADASADDKARSLVTATDLLEKQLWIGTRTQPNPPQELAWPRTGVVDREGTAVDPNTIPLQIINGAYEIAAQLLLDPEIANNATGTASNVKRLKAGSAEIEYFLPITGTRIPTAAYELLGWFLAGVSAGSNAELSVAYGTDGESAFDVGDRYTADF